LYLRRQHEGGTLGATLAFRPFGLSDDLPQKVKVGGEGIVDGEVSGVPLSGLCCTYCNPSDNAKERQPTQCLD
jgi:hypothetical protein